MHGNVKHELILRAGFSAAAPEPGIKKIPAATGSNGIRSARIALHPIQ
jgi:hypothetical protein